jgi:hypothetical protein
MKIAENGRYVGGVESVFAVDVFQNDFVTPKPLDMGADEVAGRAVQRHAVVHAMGQEQLPVAF